MGRPTTNTVDYFSHFAQHKKTMFVLEQKFKNDGYAVWFKILELLAGSENHFIDCSAENEWQFVVSKMNVEEKKLLEIFDLLVKLSAIDSELWEHRVIWCQNFVNGLQLVYAKRGRKIPDKPSFCPRNSPLANISVSESQIVSVPEMPQSIAQYRKAQYTDEPGNKLPTGVDDDEYDRRKKRSRAEQGLRTEETEQIKDLLPTT